MHEHIRGDTFSMSGPVTVMELDTATGEYARLLDLTGWSVASQIRDTLDHVVATLDATWLDAAQSLLTVAAPGSTADWQPGRVYIDVQLTSPAGDVVSTPRAEFKVRGDVTR